MMNKVSRAFAILMCVLISAMLLSFSVSARGYVDVDKMTSGGWSLTLFTCTVGGQSRIAVRCEYA